MRIGIDIDGVIVDSNRFLLDHSTEFCYKNNIQYNINDSEYDECKRMGITYEQMMKIWNKYMEYYATKNPPRTYATEVIEKLSMNNEIYIITARDEEGLPEEKYGQMKEMVKKWLSTYNIKYDKLIFSKGSKLPYCIENGIEIMIEDSPRNIKELSLKIPILCFDNSYNREIKGNNITRVYSWYDLLKKFENMYN